MLAKNDVIKEYKYYYELFQYIAQEYKDKCKSVYDELSKETAYEEICSSSDLFLGYYCPSPVYELIVGNTHRGKILKRTTTRTKPTHKYGFSQDGKLLTVVDNLCYTRCFYLYNDKTTTTICYAKNHIDYIAECQYDDYERIIKYTFCSLNDGKCNGIEQEIYTYGSEGIDTVTLWEALDLFDSFSQFPKDAFDSNFYEDTIKEIEKSKFILTIDTYKMYHDDEGYLIKYQDISKEMYKNNFFEIPKSKRKKI